MIAADPTQPVEQNIPLIVYHKNCPDGFGSAWWLGKHLGPHQKWAASYDDDLVPEFDGRDVFIVDFCYSAELMTQIIYDARSLRVLDHHETALGIVETLSDQIAVYTDYERAFAVGNVWRDLSAAESWVVLDQSHSGAGLVGMYVETRWAAVPPRWFAHLEDRDLWNFQNRPTEISVDTPAIFAAITSWPYTEQAWDGLAATPFRQLLNEGTGIERYRQNLISKIAETKHLMYIGGHEVWVVAAPYSVGSDVAHELCKEDVDRPFAAYYVVNDLDKGNLRFGLRSLPDGANVAQIAEQFGGGGHPHASGFSINDYPLRDS